MQVGKKVFLLSLLLLLLIVSCVYKHTKEFFDNSTVVTEEKVVKLEEKTEQPREISLPDEEIKEESVAVELLPADTKDKEVHESVTEKITKIEEEIKDPEPIILKRKDDGYRRSKGEFFYYELSEKSKEIQDKLYTIMKDEPFKFNRNGIEYLKKNDELLNKIYKIMINNENLKFEIAGHVSIKPDDKKYNKYISVMRAANIKKKLISMGISKRRMKARGYGDAIPFIQDDIKIFNRIEFNIIGE
ncbi:hypothetical protein CP960_11115 [Malaciobacter halophilus]|uniref:OmpA-like domain-containing protein n=1 Tax=Malaciobacter halophilus TaxID=197482 RepID=A0A2N1J0Z4_9BACT|nr:OmpA family protein [Malaciobacter halophilus]AXH08445.1 putative peptidoglycan-binding protein (OmpA domain) [Malaciobacter halophilus]PKI80164.1 hypothetical protein CP960_11115 [Malaciobacter halophilus]